MLLYVVVIWVTGGDDSIGRGGEVLVCGLGVVVIVLKGKLLSSNRSCLET